MWKDRTKSGTFSFDNTHEGHSSYGVLTVFKDRVRSSIRRFTFIYCAAGCGRLIGRSNPVKPRLGSSMFDNLNLTAQFLNHPYPFRWAIRNGEAESRGIHNLPGLMHVSCVHSQ